MKKYVMNKNVIYSGVEYKSGVEICEGDAGFKELVQNGHASVLEFKEESKKAVEPEEMHSEDTKKKKK